MTKQQKPVAILVLLTLLLGMFGALPGAAYAITDKKDINPPFGASLQFSGRGVNARDGASLGRWDVYVNGRIAGDSLVVTDYFKDGQGGGSWEAGRAWNLIHTSLVRQWEEALTPAPAASGYYAGATFKRNIDSQPADWNVQYNGSSSARFHIREMAENLGHYVDYNERSKRVDITTSDFPSGAIEYPGNIKEGDSVTINLRGTAYKSDIEEYSFYVNGREEAYGMPGRSTFSDSARITAGSGRTELQLEITDSIGRTTIVSIPYR